nr:hypothetical protein [bacterium]
MDKETVIELLNEIDSTILSGDTDSADRLLCRLSEESLTATQKQALEMKRIRLLWVQGDFEAANRRLSTLMKKTRVKQGSDGWVENYLLRAFINQSLGHTSRADKDLEKIQAAI